MQFCSGVRRGVSLLLLLGLIAVVSPVDVRAVQSGGSNLEVMICPNANESQITIVEPQSDSIVNSPKVVINGGVTYISQIDFLIDDVYNNTIALGATATEFSSTITLSPGTHTITAVATDSCSQTTHTSVVVVTYEPKTQPSIGKEVVTEVANTITNDDAILPPDPPKDFIKEIIDRTLAPPVTAISESLGITAAHEIATATKVANAARATLFVAGVTLTVTAVHVATLATLPQGLGFMQRYRRQGTGVIGVVGGLLIALVFML